MIRSFDIKNKKCYETQQILCIVIKLTLQTRPFLKYTLYLIKLLNYNTRWTDRK